MKHAAGGWPVRLGHWQDTVAAISKVLILTVPGLYGYALRRRYELRSKEIYIIHEWDMPGVVRAREVYRAAKCIMRLAENHFERERVKPGIMMMNRFMEEVADTDTDTDQD